MSLLEPIEMLIEQERFDERHRAFLLPFAYSEAADIWHAMALCRLKFGDPYSKFQPDWRLHNVMISAPNKNGETEMLAVYRTGQWPYVVTVDGTCCDAPVTVVYQGDKHET